MIQDPLPFHAANTEFAYQLHYHIGFRTRLAVPALRDAGRSSFLIDALNAICQRSNYHLLELDVEDCWTRLLVSLLPSHAPAKVVQTIKANASRVLFESFPEIESEMGRRSLWSRGYYLRSVGSVIDQTVLEYLARQAQHHEEELGNSRLLASYEHPNPQQFFDFRPFSHCVAEYNCHLVFQPLRHVPAIDDSVVEELLGHVLHVATTREFEVISLKVLQDHVHLFAALCPNQSPDYLAFSVMNDTSLWMGKRDPGAIKLWKVSAFWSPSAFIRTAGAVTTNIVQAHLRGRSVLQDE